jgi:hypothetical protein
MCGEIRTQRRPVRRSRTGQNTLLRVNTADGEPAVRDLQTGDTATELGEHVLRLEAELLEQAGMALGIDLVGQFLFGLLDLVGLALLSEQVEDLVLGDFHGVPFVVWMGAPDAMV